VLTHADGAVAANHEAGEILKRKRLKGQLRVIQDGTDIDRFKPGLGGELRNAISPKDPLVGYVGRLVTEKGIDTLLRAMADMDNETRLVLVGSGPMEGELRALARELGIADRVTFQPPVTQEEMPQWMGAFDALVLPSLTCKHWKEQLGMVLIEAMACGTPVVGSDSGEIPHVIGDAGIVFPEGNVLALTESLRGLLSNEEERKRLAEKGRQRVLDRFTIQSGKEGLSAFFSKIYGEVRRG